MIHNIKWNILRYNKSIFLENDFFWIEISYQWVRKNWLFFLFPYFDENLKTYKYLAFDDIIQRDFFLSLYKISWIWIKVAYNISVLPIETIKSSVESFDIKYFQSIPWVWPKTAKRILVELKSTFSKSDITKLNIDDKLYKDIVKTLKPLWYDTSKIKTVLEKCPIELKKENTWDIIQWLLKNI